MQLHLEIVTSESTIYSGDVDMVTVPGAAGVMGILPRHAPVLSTLRAGELRVKVGGDELEFAIGGGFVDINNNKVIILADSAERSDAIDLARAEAARQRAEELLKNPPPNKEELFKLEAALKRNQARIMVATRKRRTGGTPT